jgi:hypothetical protein
MAENLPVQHNMKGILRFDVDPSGVRGGDYVDALNIQFIGRGLGQTLPISQVLKNRLAFDMGSVVSQRKIVRISFDLNLPYQIGFLSPNGNGILYLPSGAPLTNLSVPSFASYSAYANFIAASLTNLGLSVVVSTGVGFLDIQLFTYGRLDWSLFSVGTNSFTVSIVSEAIPQNYAGILNLIGGTDLLGDAFLFSTPQRNLPVDFNCSVFSGTGGLVGIGFNTNHGLVTNDEIFIKGGASAVNGYWLVTVLSPSSVLLQFSNFAAVGAGTCVVVLNNRGVGEIGVAVQDMATKAWTYTRLLRSIEFGFTTKRQVECQGENSILGKSLYFHQVKYNPPRVFYYRGAYIQDGALSSVSSVNQYEYGSIGSEISVQLNELRSNLSLITVDVGGGSVRAGNKVYFVRFLTSEDALFGSDWHAFTNVINVYSANQFASPSSVVGDISGKVTSKTVRLLLSDIPNEFYDFVELGVAEFFGTAVQFSVIRRERVTGSQLELAHTGNETVSSLSTAEVLFIQRRIANVGSERILDNRLLYFDVDYLEEVDLSDWAASFTHRVRRFSNELIPNTGQDENVVFGAYMDPIITETKLGYSWFETYRFACRVYWKTGGVSADFWIDDVRFDALTTNVYSNTGQSRRVGPFITDYDLDFGPNQFYVPSIEFGNINLDYLIDGVPLRSLIDKIEIRRVDMDASPSYREILCSGPSVVAVTGFIRATNFNLSPTFAMYGNTTLPAPTNNTNRVRHPFPFFSGQNIAPNVPNLAQTNNYVSTNGFFSNPNAGVVQVVFSSKQAGPTLNSENQAFMYSNDILFGKKNFVFVPGDKVIRFGTMNSLSARFYQDTKDLASWIRDFRCEFGAGANVSIYPLEDSKIIFRGTQEFLVNNQIPFANYAYSKRSATFNVNQFLGLLDPPIPTTYTWETSLAYSVDTSSGFDNFGNPNEGVFYTSYYRERFYQIGNPDNSKFGRRDESSYISTNSFLDIDESITQPIQSVIAFGGDTFISRMEMKLGSHNEEDLSFDFSGSSFAMAFTSQSLVNPYMRNVVDTDPAAAFPAKPFQDYKDWLENELLDQTNYDLSYNQRQVNTAIGYKAPVANDGKLPTRILWSNLKPEGSFTDSYREFPPLNFKDLDRIYGRIVHAEVINSDLFVMQERKWQREFFNTTGLTSVSPDDLIALGNTGVMSRNGVGLSSYGTRHKWSAIKGKLSSGADCIAWIDVENGVVVRYGGDGTRVISSPDSWWQFIKANTDWVFDFDTPADGRGIMGVWNERFKEFRWAIRGHRRPDISNWVARVNYFVGQTVRVPGIGFEEVLLKECILDHESNQSNNPVTGINKDTFWRLVDVSDNRHFNVYSMVYSEIKNGITTKVSPVPYIKIPWRQDFISQKYGNFASKPIFLENEGLTSWYDSGGSSLVADSFIEPVINYNPDQIKEFLALYVDSSLVPDRVEFETELHRSYLLSSDFTFREGVWVSPIKMDTLQAVNGTNDEDTSKLFGRWIKIKIFINAGNSQSLRNIRVRLKYNARYIQT